MAALSTEETELVTLLLLMTGREERLARKPWIEQGQIIGIQAIWPTLKTATEKGMKYEARCDLVNRLLLTLGIMTISPQFFQVVFHNANFSKLEDIQTKINLFRTLCMLDYGSFRFGYKRLRDGKLIKEKWNRYFPDESEATMRAQAIRDSPAPVGLTSIQASKLFALGYLASEQAADINAARKQLTSVIQRALDKEVKHFKGLVSTAKELGIEGLPQLIGKVGIPRTEELLYPDLPLFAKKQTYVEILTSVRENCVPVDEKAIEDTQAAGMQNARTYMAMHDLDIYVATSMRDPLHFTTNWTFVQRLFHNGDLAEWNLRYFDPTQAFLLDRIQKGLMECLMIKRAKLTVYNAQESDTFGKDSEAGVTLAQAKPVVVFVARLFDHNANFTNLYQAIDQAPRILRDEFVNLLQANKLLTTDDAKSLLGPEKGKPDAIEFVIRKHAPPLLEQAGADHVGMELIRQGYEPKGNSVELNDFAVERILRLERRALTFRDVHPLALQTSPMDGVARGVIVTRTVEDTARVVSGLLRGTLQYEIVQEDANWLLVETITRSPVRVVTKDPVLTSAFWSEQWGSN